MESIIIIGLIGLIYFVGKYLRKELSKIPYWESIQQLLYLGLFCLFFFNKSYNTNNFYFGLFIVVSLYFLYRAIQFGLKKSEN